MKKSIGKYRNKKVTVGGVKFDSKIEAYAYGRLKQFNIPFDFQVWHTIQEPFRYKGEHIRAIKMKIDFVIHTEHGDLVLDTKGYATDVAILKYKILKDQQTKELFPQFYHICWAKNNKEIDTLIREIHERKRF